MTKVVTCKNDTDELIANTPYEVLDERSWGYRLLVGKVAAWFRKDIFYRPYMVGEA